MYLPAAFSRVLTQQSLSHHTYLSLPIDLTPVPSAAYSTRNLIPVALVSGPVSNLIAWPDDGLWEGRSVDCSFWFTAWVCRDTNIPEEKTG